MDPTLLLPINAIPRDNFLFMPPERVLTILLILSARPTCLCNKSYPTSWVGWIVLQVNNANRVLVILVSLEACMICTSQCRLSHPPAMDPEFRS